MPATSSTLPSRPKRKSPDEGFATSTASPPNQGRARCQGDLFGFLSSLLVSTMKVRYMENRATVTVSAALLELRRGHLVLPAAGRFSG